jgi:ribonuclease-3
VKLTMPRKKPKKQTQARPELESLEESLGHTFADRRLLARALVHSSWAHEKGMPGEDNESLEFLGDSVLSLCVSRMLFERFGQGEVGELARVRSFLVSEPSLARKARALHLGPHLNVGRGEEKGGGREKDSLLADAYEAVLAAVYLDGGLTAAAALVTRQFAAQIARADKGGGDDRDYKTRLQEALQGAGLPLPLYRVSAEAGPDHKKEFHVELVVSDRVVARGKGTTKKTAEQEAARRALRALGPITAARES